MMGVRREEIYRAARPAFATGDLLCFRGRGLVSWLIRKLTRSAWSHVGMVYLFEDRVYCLEAVGSGVRLVLVSVLVERYHGGIDYFDVLDVEEHQRRGALSFGFQQLGKPYDRPGIWRFLWFLVYGKRRRVREDDLWFCSEIFAEAWRRQRVPLVDAPPDYTAPHDLATSARVRYRYTVKP
jgi:uncharacterized protein YycO